MITCVSVTFRGWMISTLPLLKCAMASSVWFLSATHEQVEQSSAVGAEKENAIRPKHDTSISIWWHNNFCKFRLCLIANDLTRMCLTVWEVEITNWTFKAVDVVQGSCRLHLSHTIQLTAVPGHYTVHHFTFLFHLKHKVGVFTLKLTSTRAQKPVEHKT